VDAATAEDAAQEALVVAWRRLGHLHSAEHFDAWLDRICRNVTLHHLRRGLTLARHEGPLPWAADDPLSGGPQGDIPDPDALDLAEALDRRDLEALLDRALGHLSGGARELVELAYLADLPRREVAARLGLTLGALEARLHRSRAQLRLLLSGELRDEAEGLGLPLDADVAAGWRETREWCNFCGRRRLLGRFDPLPDGRVNFRLRCPACSRRFGGDVYSTGGMIPLAGQRAFRPALKRLIRRLKEHYALGSARALADGWQPCPGCGRPAATRLIEPGGGIGAFADQVRLVIMCPRCGAIVTPATFAAYWGDPAARPLALEFIEAHPRWQMEPDVIAEYDGQPAARFRMADAAGRARLTILAHARTLRILAIHAE